MAYKKPILLEIYTELYLKKGSLSQNNFFDLVPRLKEKGFPNHELTQSFANEKFDAKNGVIEQILVPRIKCWSENRKSLIQISPDSLTVNMVQEYRGWEAYLETFTIGVDAILESGIKLDCESLRLATIDQFEVPRATFTAGKYLNCGGNKIPSWYSDAVVAFDYNIGKGFIKVDDINRQINLKVRPKENIVHIRFESHFHNKLGSRDLFAELEALHQESRESFESIITDEVRNVVMGGKA